MITISRLALIWCIFSSGQYLDVNQSLDARTNIISLIYLLCATIAGAVFETSLVEHAKNNK